MVCLARGRYQVRLAETPEDIAAAQRLRYRAFRGPGTGLDQDRYDLRCDHMLVEDRRDGDLVCCFRLMVLSDGREIHESYAAQYYGLTGLHSFEAPMIEMGRFCLHPDNRDPDVIRIAWAAMTRYVEAQGAGLLFGCASFQGTDADAYQDAFALLKDRHLAPRRWLPKVKAPAVFRFAQSLAQHRPDLKSAARAMPPLLRSYLLLGGWVSDHAVVDRDLNTLHVFTGLEIRAIPPGRVQLLRAVAG